MVVDAVSRVEQVIQVVYFHQVMRRVDAFHAFRPREARPTLTLPMDAVFRIAEFQIARTQIGTVMPQNANAAIRRVIDRKIVELKIIRILFIADQHAFGRRPMDAVRTRPMLDEPHAWILLMRLRPGRTHDDFRRIQLERAVRQEIDVRRVVQQHVRRHIRFVFRTRQFGLPHIQP